MRAQKMGLRLPIYPYYTAQGRPSVKREKGSRWNDIARSQLEDFVAYLSLDDVRQIAFNYIPPLGKINVSKSDWSSASVFDEDDVNHVGLASLMTRVGKHGTILIPDETHILGKERHPPTAPVKKLMKQFDLDDIEILPLVFEMNGKAYDLKEYPKKYAESGKPDPELFELMPPLARAFVDYLKRHVNSGSGKRLSP
jgi:hypothetical protein